MGTVLLLLRLVFSEFSVNLLLPIPINLVVIYYQVSPPYDILAPKPKLLKKLPLHDNLVLEIAHNTIDYQQLYINQPYALLSFALGQWLRRLFWILALNTAQTALDIRL